MNYSSLVCAHTGISAVLGHLIISQWTILGVCMTADNFTVFRIIFAALSHWCAAAHSSVLGNTRKEHPSWGCGTGLLLENPTVSIASGGVNRMLIFKGTRENMIGERQLCQADLWSSIKGRLSEYYTLRKLLCLELCHQLVFPACSCRSDWYDPHELPSLLTSTKVPLGN